MLGYTVARKGNTVVSSWVAAKASDESPADVAEAVGKQLLEVAQAAGDEGSRSLRSVDELLRDAYPSESGETREHHEPVHSGSQKSWIRTDGPGWVHAARFRDSGNGPAVDPQSQAFCDALLQDRRSQVSTSGEDRLGWDVGTSGRKLNLNVRDVDDETLGDGPEWVASRSYGGRKVLSKSDLKALLSESAESRDSM